MSQTFKDKNRLSTSAKVFEIRKKPDGSFDIFCNDELADFSIPDSWLESQLQLARIATSEVRNLWQRVSGCPS
jgi:hypothetical protein